MLVAIIGVVVLARGVHSFSSSAVLDEQGAVRLWWSTTETSLVFRLAVVSESPLGYMALGLSHSGGMHGADIAMALLHDDGRVSLRDAFAVGNSAPLVDDQQNLNLLSSRRNGSRSEVVFERHESCDSQDISIVKDRALSIIWAVGVLNDAETYPQYHESHRGQRLINLYRHSDVEVPRGALYLDVLVPDVVLPKNDRTFYFCRITKLPHFPRKVHVIGFEGLLQKGNEAFVHHIILYECTVPTWRREAFEKYVDSHHGARCYSPNMPVDWGRCGHILAVWAVGGSGEMLPKDVGIPLREEHGGATYLMTEVHYDNPQVVPGVVDRSGIRLFYSEQLRPFEAGLLNVGHDIAVTQMIPPGQTAFSTIGLCHSTCTEDFPADGILVYSVLLHAHLTGVRMRLRHVTADGSELPAIAEDLSYNFNYQQTRTMDRPVRVHAGDQLLVECVYDTQHRENLTFGGLNAENEMCLAFISYYPRVALSICWSSPDMGRAMEQLGISAANAYGMELPVRRAGDMIQRVINNLESFARAEWDLSSPPAELGDEYVHDETDQHLYEVALQDQRIMTRLKADNLTALEALGMQDLPEPLQDPFLLLKDILVIHPDQFGMSTLFQFLLEHPWDSQSVQMLQIAATAFFKPKCVWRNGSIVNSPTQLLEFDRDLTAPAGRCSVTSSGGQLSSAPRVAAASGILLLLIEFSIFLLFPSVM